MGHHWNSLHISLRSCHQLPDPGILIKLDCMNKMDLFSNISMANKDPNNFQSNCLRAHSNQRAEKCFQENLWRLTISNLWGVFIIAFSLEEEWPNGGNACIFVASIIIHMTLNNSFLKLTSISEFLIAV